jgi:hypothetical protein
MINDREKRSGLINTRRPDFKKAKAFMRYVSGFSEFERQLRRRGKWVDFVNSVAKHVDGDYVDIHLFKKVMNDYGYNYETMSTKSDPTRYPEGFEFKDQLGEMPAMPPSIRFVWFNLQNVPVEYIQDKSGSYDRYKNLFLVHPWDAPDWGCFNMLLFYARNQREFYKAMMASMIYAPLAISLKNAPANEYHQLVSAEEKSRDREIKGLKSKGQMAEIALRGAEGGVTGTFEVLEQALKDDEARHERTLSNKAGRRTSILWRDPPLTGTTSRASTEDGGTREQE